MDPQPLYLPGKATPAYQLRFSWTGWPESGGLLPEIPSQWFDQLSGLWKSDGLNLLEYRATEELVQLLFSTKPNVAPTFLAARAKGRLDHALRQAGLATKFSRKVSVRSIGENTNTDVQTYIQQQIANEGFVDQKFADSIAPFTQTFADVDTSQPIQATRGRYWYNLHIVLVHVERFRFKQIEQFRRSFDRSRAIAKKKGYRLASISVMPDHLHLALVGQEQESPETIVLAFQNNLSYAHGQGEMWCQNYFVGTMGEYNMNAIRAALADR